MRVILIVTINLLVAVALEDHELTIRTTINITDDQTNSSHSDVNFPCKKHPSTRNILLATLCTFVCIFGIFGNALSIGVILLTRDLRNKCAYYFIVSLASADIGVSIFVTSLKIDMYRHNQNFCLGIEMCYLFVLTDFLFPIASITHLLVIAIDRCVAITRPYFYSLYFTERKGKLIVCIIWLWCILWACLGVLSWEAPSKQYIKIVERNGRFCYNPNKYYITVMLSVIIIIPTLMAFFLYMIILRIAIKQEKFIAKMSASSLKKRHIEMKATKMVALVFAFNVICWVPHFVIILLQYWKLDLLQKFDSNHPALYNIVTSIFNYVLPTINSCANPFLYFLAGSHFRNALQDIIRKIGKKSRCKYDTYGDVSKFTSIYGVRSTQKLYRPAYTSNLQHENGICNSNDLLSI
ncbi:cysteinyl leukotriene receptor 2 [Hydra vulgaris]|uniref:cysteinyl leukotriene receptor 2 n=1 Tax=Hydra vulgaris TaxID=6087 RepID=UPI0002B4B30C|nr:cysteinyl leukotriene receptor 2 [Hydra vulgaris]XP_047141673.1 cysteinyl leukotriene receptor 2 [Hydra vulgaris]